MNRYEAAVLDSYLGTKLGLVKDREKFMHDVFGDSFPSNYRKELLPYLQEVIETKDTLTETELALISIHTGCMLTSDEVFYRYIESKLGVLVNEHNYTAKMIGEIRKKTLSDYNKLAIDGPKPIYTVTVLGVDEEKALSNDPNVRYESIESISTFGYFHELELAMSSVMNNDLDIWEYSYNYAVIEEVHQGLYPSISDEKWYKYNAYKDGLYIGSDGKYEPISKPKFVGHMTAFCMN